MAYMILEKPRDFFQDGSVGKCSVCHKKSRADYNYCPWCGSIFNSKIQLHDDTKKVGRLLAICGPSSSGKTFMARKIMEKCANENITCHQVVSCTTRPPRPGEVNGKDYHFITQEEFYDMVEKGLMLEYTEFRGWHYGTPKNEIKPGILNIGVFNPLGISNMTKTYHEDIFIRVVELRASFMTRMKRSISRESKFRFEFLRRAITDHFDVKKLDYPWVENAKLFSYIDTDNPIAIAYEVENNINITRFIHGDIQAAIVGLYFIHLLDEFLV